LIQLQKLSELWSKTTSSNLFLKHGLTIGPIEIYSNELGQAHHILTSSLAHENNIWSPWSSFGLLKVHLDVTPTSPTSNASTSPSLYQGPITISMMRKIHMGLSQDDQVNHGLFTLFTWAKEISKIWDDAWRK